MATRPETAFANVRYELDIRERIVRVEEELKHQRELMLQGFETSNRRFEDMNKRFEEMRTDMNKRFEQVDKRFEQIDKHLTIITNPSHGQIHVLVARLNHFCSHRHHQTHLSQPWVLNRLLWIAIYFNVR